MSSGERASVAFQKLLRSETRSLAPPSDTGVAVYARTYGPSSRRRNQTVAPLGTSISRTPSEGGTPAPARRPGAPRARPRPEAAGGGGGRGAGAGGRAGRGARGGDG